MTNQTEIFQAFFKNKQDADKVANNVIAELGSEWVNANYQQEIRFTEPQKKVGDCVWLSLDAIVGQEGEPEPCGLHWRIQLKNPKRNLTLRLSSLWWTLTRAHEGRIAHAKTPRDALVAGASTYKDTLKDLERAVESLKGDIKHMLG